MQDIKLIQGDCLQVMQQLIDEGVKVDAIITDPPYGTMNTDGGRKLGIKGWDTTLDHEKMLDACNSLLRKNGALVLFSQDPYTSKLRTQTHGNMPFSYSYTWLKDHFSNCLGCKKAPVNYTEDVNVFFKSYKKYDYNNINPLRDYAKKVKSFIGKGKKQVFEDMGGQGICHFFRTDTTQFGLCTEKTYNQLIDIYKIDQQEWFMGYKKLLEINKQYLIENEKQLWSKYPRIFNLPEGKKYKSNVLEYKKDYTGHHPTQKPVALMEDLIKTYTNEGDTVLDFTCGSGTTGVACVNTGRKFIGIELDEGYYKIAVDRIEEARCKI